MRTKNIMPVHVVILFCMSILLPAVSHSQVNIRGKVIYKREARPAAQASVSLLRRNRVVMTDEAGDFSILVPALKNNDTLVISSVGYETLRIPAKAAMHKTEFELTEFSKNLANVTVKSFMSRDMIGASGESVGYFRSWNFDSTGGEIGRIFNVPYSEYKVDKIRFKVSNFCDTCLVRLHIRKMVDNMPGEELLKDSIGLIIRHLTLDDKAPEFDLSPYDLVLNQPEVFIGFELINCKHPGKKDCSLCFAGTEEGNYVYKSTRASQWEKTDAFAIYLKIFLRY